MVSLDKFDVESINQTFMSYKSGQMIDATLVSFLGDGAVVNIGGKKDGFIKNSELENKALEKTKAGDSFQVVIISTKDESGMIIVSKAKADAIVTGNALLGELKVGDTTKFIITDETKNGLISALGSFRVFIPYSQISNRRIDSLKNYINKQVDAAILEIDMANNSIIASIKAIEEKELQTKETAFWNAIFENKVVSGKVVRFAEFGAFIDVDGVDCLVHNSEASYDHSKKASDVLELSKEYQFRVIKVDRVGKKVSLSIKALEPNPMEAKIKKVKVGDVVEGKVERILPFGAVISFGEGLEGLLHVKEASHYYVKNVYEVAKVGQTLTLKIISIEPETFKIGLSLKALQEEPEVLKFQNAGAGVETNTKINNDIDTDDNSGPGSAEKITPLTDGSAD
ncbi:MAG: S1 RNA-binding domain-containing protein [Christensenellaceae bacterium]|jgi:ribosomal protein S1|nr:S1 RNA-binding domain-containing protein [Christensenellaceae bacterium]